MKGILHVDIEKCLGCKSCELACALEHSESKDLLEAIEEEPLPESRVRVEAARQFSIPLQCRHCEEPPCALICPTKALVKQGIEEPVLIKEERCIGCKWCILLCPFGVLSMSRNGKAVLKCDLCSERLQKGQIPACVSACPTKALSFKSLEEITKESRKKTVEDFLVLFGPQTEKKS